MTKVKVTEEQLAKEKEIQDIVELCASTKISKEEANKQIGDLLKAAYQQGIFSKEDISSYNGRRDREDSELGQRSHIEFALALKYWHAREKAVFKKFYIWLTECKGLDVTYNLLGSDDNGYVMIANFDDRYDSPSRPDYEVDWTGHMNNVEVKNRGKRIWLKMGNMRKYRKWESYMVMRFNKSYYFFSKTAIGYMLDNMPYRPAKVVGKECLIITMDGYKAHFSLKDLLDKKLVKEIGE